MRDGKPVIAVYASHSAIQVIRGAYEERLDVVLFGPSNRIRLYKRFPLLSVYPVECEPSSCLEMLDSNRHVIIPNGSLVEYIGAERLHSSKIPMFGLRDILKWESNWELKMKLLKEAGLKTPKVFSSPDEIDRPVIVKLPGAKGGAGYILSNNPSQVKAEITKILRRGIINDPSEACIQEYVIGTTIYIHYFYSPIMDRLEITGFDVRYETNVDGIRRLPPEFLKDTSPTFVVVGNFPVYPREALLEEFIEYGERFVKATRRLVPPGMIGPFCLEAVLKDDLEPIFFEFSGRIVAGTNVYLAGSPYLALYWGESMTVGRRIAKEIRMAYEENRLNEVLT